MTHPNLLLVDDDPGMLRLLELRLSSEGFDVNTASNGELALAEFKQHHPQVVVTDLKMDGMDGLELLESVHQINPSTPVIMITAHGSIPDAMNAAQSGVHSFLTKPLDRNELVEKIHSALKQSGAANTTSSTSDIATAFCTQTSELITTLEQAKVVASSTANILITGESGTGKEVLANTIHQHSDRSEQPFIAVNCAAIPDSLLESELFGHRKGAFTGANEHRDGYFKQADGGTLFLDEIGDMPLALQAKLLRVIQEKIVRPIGSDRDIPVNVRIVSATHRNLQKCIEDNSFRADLFYRLNVVTLTLPQLNERRGDIPLLANRFLNEIATRDDKHVTSFAKPALEALLTANWPGNIRQLRNVVEQCVVLSSSPVISEALVNKAIQSDSLAIAPLSEAKAEFEKNYLVRLLQMTQGNVTDASLLAKRNRTQFYKLLDKYDIQPKEFKTALS